ncbi:MAG: nucleotide-binding universal stress UspA family protein [Hyphomicrobiaceae bacterium]|jgi:nucleotide-binding universal stress UspA family protein
MKKFKAQVAITASHTSDGSVVYVAPDGTWVASLDRAAVWPDETTAAHPLALARADEITVCDAYLIDVEISDGHPVVSSVRERIRATGATTRLRRPNTAATGA